MNFFDKLKKKKQLDALQKQQADVKVEAQENEKTRKQESESESTSEVGVEKKSVNFPSRTAKVLVRPVVSEKAAHGENKGKYTFVVSSNANKMQVKQAIKEVYGVTPKKVRVQNIEGKRKRFGRIVGKRSDWKKAIVTLQEGNTISIHEGV